MPVWFIVKSAERRQNKGMFIEYNPNPVARKVGDCSVRALSKALNTDWETAYDLLTDAGKAMGDMPSSNAVIGAVLREHGFYRKSVPNYCPDCFTAYDFTKIYPYGIYVLFFDNHVATAVDGDLFDSWDSSNELPQFYWYKKE